LHTKIRRIILPLACKFPRTGQIFDLIIKKTHDKNVQQKFANGIPYRKLFKKQHQHNNGKLLKKVKIVNSTIYKTLGEIILVGKTSYCY
jgi:hypothetical protein